MNEVYLITNRVNGKRYVGITCRGYLERFKEHVHESMNGSKSILHNAIRKYGPDNFDVILLEGGISDKDSCSREMYYISLYNTMYTSGIGYNMTQGGGGVVGYRHTEDTRRKISNSLSGHVFPESRNKKIQEAMTGREYKPEWREALSKSRLGRFCKEENSFYGKHHTSESKEKVSRANTKHSVLQLDINSYEVIREFSNSRSAGEWIVENGYSAALPSTCEGRISEVCRKADPKCSAYGFRWRFEERSID